MAGDWIKVQCTTPDKPEVVAMAERLGIDQDAVVGKLIRLWVWADQQTVDGDAVNVTPAFIDRLTYCPGFAAAAVAVGWLIDRQGRLSIPHFDRHNGQSAKNRALTADRNRRLRDKTDEPSQPKRQRDAASVTKSSPEKRREENTEQEAAPRGRPQTDPKAVPEFDPWLEAFLALWNATPGTVQATELSTLQRRVMDARRVDPWFAKNYRAALERFPLPYFEHHGNRVGISKFLEDGFAEGVIEGKYHNDWSKTNERSSGRNGRKKSRATDQEEANVAALLAFAEDALQPGGLCESRGHSDVPEDVLESLTGTNQSVA